MRLLPPAKIDGLELHELARKKVPGKCGITLKDAGLPWWWLAVPLWHRDAFVTWRHFEWWWQEHEQVRGTVNLLFTRLGFWDIGQAGYFDKGRWRLDFWRSPRSWWQVRKWKKKLVVLKQELERQTITPEEYRREADFWAQYKENASA